jgi:hypothetical protein
MEELVHLYRRKFRPRVDKEADWFAGQPSLALAISFAGLARDWRGKRLTHGNRLRPSQLQRAERALLAVQPRIARCRSFDELHGIVSRCLQPIWKNPELFSYDTALRIGVKLGLAPRKVYLHRGTRKGAHALGLSTKVGFLTIDQLPPELQVLEPGELEDFLCIFKDHLGLACGKKLDVMSSACASSPRQGRC